MHDLGHDIDQSLVLNSFFVWLETNFLAQVIF